MKKRRDGRGFQTPEPFKFYKENSRQSFVNSQGVINRIFRAEWTEVERDRDSERTLQIENSEKRALQ